MYARNLSLAPVVAFLTLFIHKFHLYLLDKADARIDAALYAIGQYRKLNIHNPASSKISMEEVDEMEVMFRSLTQTNRTLVDHAQIRAFVWNVFKQSSRWSRQFSEIEQDLNLYLLFRDMFGM